MDSGEAHQHQIGAEERGGRKPRERKGGGGGSMEVDANRYTKNEKKEKGRRATQPRSDHFRPRSPSHRGESGLRNPKQGRKCDDRGEERGRLGLWLKVLLASE
jgi:hypothetical protein